MKITYNVHLEVTVDRDAVPLTKQQVKNMTTAFFANPQPLPANWSVLVLEIGKVEFDG